MRFTMTVCLIVSFSSVKVISVTLIVVNEKDMDISTNQTLINVKPE